MAQIDRMREQFFETLRSPGPGHMTEEQGRTYNHALAHARVVLTSPMPGALEAHSAVLAAAAVFYADPNPETQAAVAAAIDAPVAEFAPSRRAGKRDAAVEAAYQRGVRFRRRHPVLAPVAAVAQIVVVAVGAALVAGLIAYAVASLLWAVIR